MLGACCAVGARRIGPRRPAARVQRERAPCAPPRRRVSYEEVEHSVQDTSPVVTQ